jgi:hypothetical protein
MEHVAQQASAMVQMEKYGETNEGKPLLLMYVTSRENFPNLENIRKNNLRLANTLRDNTTPVENAPSIVWLSYNVHGNEPSSSEAAMLTLYELVNPENSKSKGMLKNAVVIIDPCINPDGRDRYVNWINQTVGKFSNAYVASREHNEPWPGGRTNHYYFDLNRDWAWQTQVETQQRIVKYNQWLPQVHVDFHEQWYNDPYYFAPAAEPFHEVITSWQREFQTIIGKNNAKYFDENGWLYFTKERFDLFYPSYGDTYPTYNGAIGMTYEQGGHSMGGLAVATDDGDTLTLKDRVLHHFTTGISTIEITAQNAQRVVKEFRKYFVAAVQNPGGEFKSWVIKNDNTDRIERLKQLLTRNGIEWNYAPVLNQSGINYFTGRVESFKANAEDIVVNMNQPKSNLIKVLFERTSRLSDSATYDITAWSIPFAYGLKTYGLREYIDAGAKKNTASVTKENFPQSSRTPYAYAIKWNGLNSARFLSALLRMGIKLRYSEQGFTSEGISFEKGTLLVTRSGNNNIGKELEFMVQKAAAEAGVSVTTLFSGFVERGADLGSDRVRFIRTPKVALVSGEGVNANALGELWHFFDQQLNYPVSLINAKDLLTIDIANINVLVFADGSYAAFQQKEQNEQLKEFVRKGGKIIAIDHAVGQMSRNDWGFKLKGSEERPQDDKKEDYNLLKKYEARERDGLTNNITGSIFKVEMDPSHPLGFGYTDGFYTLKQNADIYEFLKDGWNVGVIKKDNYISGFTGSKVKEKLHDGTLIGAMEMGRGLVIFIVDAPMFRSFWENGKLLFCNAVFMAGQ